MELLAEIFGFIFIELILSVVGWLCLFVWYRNRKKMQQIKDEKYAGEYSSAGRVMILNLVAGLGAITMFSVVIAFLIAWIYQFVTH